MPLPFNKTLDLKLLELVKENPILYNTKHSKYLDFDSREVVWQKIGDALSRPAAEFAGIQCQVQFGDYQEDKHKPGFIENLSEFLPTNYLNAWGIEKKVYKAHRKYHGMQPLEAKNTYIKTARELPTYGVTFFLVKEKQPGKMRLVPRLLGINAEAILRLDENSKEILQQWPLTHVKTYHVGKSDTFTLKFGDWSDKEYSCKTQDVLRIRDILVGYIDLIQRRMFAKPQVDPSESMTIYQDSIQSGQSHTMQLVSQKPTKLIQETFVGPTKLVPFEQGASPQQGTQMMTVHQIIQTSQINNPQQAAVGGAAELRGHSGGIPVECVRKLKRMNSNSIKIVDLLTDPTEEHVNDARDKVNKMTEDFAVVEKGVKATAEQQSVEESRKMLLDEMQDLMTYMNQLTTSTAPGHTDTSEAKDAAEKIADLTVKMTFAQDPKMRRRSELLNSSKKSFIAGEKMDATIRRASLIAATSTALAGIDHATQRVAEPYNGQQVDDDHARQLEKALQDKIGRLNAALALYLTAHSDMNNIDYPAAINSMHNIKELMKNLPADAQMLASTKDPAARKDLLNDMQTLFDGARKLCSLTEADEHDKIQEACNKYANVADKLLFTFTKGRNLDKENEIVELSRAVGDKTSLLLMSANDLISQASTEPEAAELDAAGVRSAAAARDLTACAQLTAPAIHEPHCRSAMTAAGEGLTSSLHKLSSAWKPLVVDPTRHHLADELHHREMDIHKALEKLNNALSNINDPEDESLPVQERQRLKYIYSLAGAKSGLEGLQCKLDQPGVIAGDKADEEAARRRLSQQLAQLNAAVAALSHATRDPKNPDYATAEWALSTISQLTPQIVKDMSVVSCSQDEGTRNAMQQNIIDLCEASKEMLANVERMEGLGEAASKFGAASSKLTFLISPGADKGMEKMMAKVTAEIYDNAAELVSRVPRDKWIEPAAAAVLTDKANRVDSAAKGLQTVAQVTAPSVSDTRCASALSSAVEELRSTSTELVTACEPHLVPGAWQQQQLDECYQNLNKNIDYLEQLCQLNDIGEADNVKPHNERRRLQFISSVADAKSRIAAAEEQMKRPLACAMMREEDAIALEQRLSDKMAQLNAAIAALAHATHDRNNPDYAKARRAADTISELIPQIIQDSRVVCGTKGGAIQELMLHHVKQLCEASKNVCDNAGEAQGLNDAAARYKDASSKLMMCLSPSCGADKQQEIVALSATSCVRASELLSQVQALTQEVGGDVATDLDQRGAKTADAAQNLLAVAQVTAPSINSPECLKSLESAVETLRGSANDLTAACSPHAKPNTRQHLSDSQKQLNHSLDELLRACRETPSGVPGALSDKQREKQRLQYITSLSGARGCFDDAQQQLGRPVVCALMKESDAAVLQQQLSDRVAQLNAAIAALIGATSDRENPDYASAQQAVNTITILTPLIVQDTRVLSGTKDGATQERMLQEVQKLCDASKALCADGDLPIDLREAAANFSQASGRLMFTVSPRANEVKRNQIVDLSAASCVRASELLSQVQALTQQVEGDVAADLDQRGAKTADAAQNLLAVAQVTAPSINSPQCLKSLESAVETLRGSADDLTAACSPHAKPDARQHLNESRKQLNHSLDELLRACKETPSSIPGALPDKKQEKQRLQFIDSLSGARSCFDDAQQHLERPVVCALMKESDAAALQQQLSDRLAQLNAAIAALIGATSDRENPDYASAQRAVNTITTLTPLIVQDTRVLSGTKDGATQERMLQEVQKLCDASKAICADGDMPTDLREAAANFSQASSRLMFTVSPRVSDVKRNQIVDLSAASCVRASELLSQVQALTQQVGGDVATDLDQRGAKTADAAQNLLAVAQVTAPSINSPQCLKSLESAVETLRGSAGELTAACSQHAQPGARKHLSDSQKQLNHSLDELLRACRETPRDVPGALSDKQQEKQRLQFNTSLSDARNFFDDVRQQLKRPVVCPPMKESDAAALQHQLLDRVAQLNAAIAALINATSDREHPDYVRAQKAVNTITALTPQIVQDTRVLGSNKDSDTQERMLQEMQKLCDASKALCVDGDQPQDLREAAANFSQASSRLMFTVSPRANDAKRNQIVDLSAASCVRASELLSQVQALTQQVEGDVATDLDQRGARTADAAQNLLAVAQVTALSISSPQCLTALESAAETLRGSAAELTAACSPHAGPDARQHLSDSQKQLNHILDELLRACRASSGMPESLPDKQRDKQRLQFTNCLSAAKNCFDNAHHQLKQPVVCALMKESDGAALQQQLLDRVAQLNAAIAALIDATSDRENPDYANAQKAVNTITTLTPLIVRDTRVLSGTKDGATQERMLQEVQKLCDASKAICNDGEQPKDLREAAANFSQASSSLMFTVSPEASDVKRNQIVDLSAASCVRASELLSQVQALTQQVGGDVATDLDRRGANTADAAQNLLAVAQVTAPSISSPQCQRSLESAVKTLRGSAAELTAACNSHAQPDTRKHLNDSQQQLNHSLDELLRACKETPNAGVPTGTSSAEREKQRLQFINSLTGAKSCFDDAHARLEQPVVRELLRQESGEVLEYQLSERMAQLNAAIAALALSVHDRENPDYASAQKAVHNITSLMPHLVQDAKSLSSTKDEEAQLRALHQAQQLCDATRSICEHANDPQSLREAVVKFADASSRLNYIVSPRADHAKEKQIVDLSAASCVRASELLSQVQALTQQVGRDVATDLDQRGAKSADAAQALLTVAQVTAARIDSPHCQEALKKAVAILRGSAAELTAACAPHVTPGAQQRQLQESHKQLEISLDQLLQACRDSQTGAGGVPVHHDVERIKFIRSVSTVSRHLDDAEKEVKEPLVCYRMQSSESMMLQNQLTARLAQLNAAIAALTSATTDHKQPDYTTAERAIITISKLMPTVVQDAKKMSCTKDDNCQNMIQDNLKKLYEASREICANAGDPKKLNEAAAKFAITSGQLVCLVGAEDTPQSATVLTSQAIKGKGPKPAVPIRSTKAGAHAVPSRNSRTTQDFLDNLRAEESQDKAVRVVDVEVKGSKVQEKEDKLAQEQFSLAIETAQDEIKYAQGSLTAVKSKQIATPGIDALELVRKEQHMEEMLGKAGMEVATLVSANYANKLDYKVAKEPIVTLTKAVRVAVEDGSAISSTLQEEARKKFLSDMMGLCDATQNICDASRNDTQKLNDAAIIFSNQSVKLLRAVGANVNPALEKEVMSRAKSIGDSASRLAMEASAVASSTNPNSPTSLTPSQAQSICTAGAQCVDAAGKLVYTAKLITPTIHHSTCQETLISSADIVSANLATFSETWKPLAGDPHATKLTEEARNLQMLLEDLKADVKDGKLSKQRGFGRIVMLDTPLRELTCQVIENAKHMAEHGELSAEDKQKYVQYSGRLAEALRALDLAYARCQRSPQDNNRRCEMFSAIGDLEVLALQSRPARAGLEMSNIVDFRDFLEGMVTESNKLMKTADKYQAATGKRLANDVKVMCTKINEESPKLLNPTQHVGYDTFDDIMEFDKFAQDCNLLAKELNSKIQGIPDQKAKVALRSKLLPVIENLNLLRFATNSAMSTAQSASYDAALQDLDNFQNNVMKAVIERAKKNKTKDKLPVYVTAHANSGGQVRLLNAVRGEPQALCRELTGYAIRTIANTTESDGFEDDLKALADNMQDVTVSHSVRAANGLRAADDHNTIITLQDMMKNRRRGHPSSDYPLNRSVELDVAKLESTNLEELAKYVGQVTDAHTPTSDANLLRPRQLVENLSIKDLPDTGKLMKAKTEIHVLKDEVVDKLLTCEKHKVEGTQSQLEEQFQQLAAKLNIMSSNIFLSLKKPELASKSLHNTAEVAHKLANTARSLQDDTRPIQSKKIEDASYSMSLATYNLLKTSELLCQEPNHHGARRRLMEALHLLNDAVNKLERTLHPEPKVSRDCAEHLRSLQLQSAVLQSSPQPVSASPYAHCLDALQSQRDVLMKLNSDQAMSREEFLKSMMFITTAVGNSTECAAQAAYLLSVSDNDKNLAVEGLVDTGKMQNTITAIHDSCVSVVMNPEEQAKEEKKVIEKLVDELLKDLDETTQKAKDQDLKKILKKCKEDVNFSAKALYNAINKNQPEDVIRDLTLGLIDDVLYVDGVLQDPTLLPTAGQISADRQAQYDDVVKYSTDLVSKTQDLMKEIKSSPEQSEVMKWSSYSKRRDVLAAFDALLKSIKLNGQNASILEAEPDESDEKSYVQIQTETAFKWLHKPMAKSDIKANGQQAAKNLIDVGKKMVEDLSGADKEDMHHLVEETEQLFTQCCKRYDQEQYGLLMERIRELRKAIERIAVTRVVEDFMDAEEPLADLEILADAEKDEKTRKFLLERKIAELLAQLAGITRTARFIADTGSGGRAITTKLKTCSEQTELLAPMLVKAAEERINKPDDKAIIDNYKALLAQYIESLANIRELCDQSIDPMEFVQAAGETMQRMREESTRHNDPMKCAYTSTAITKLANRVIHVGLSSSSARNDPELAQALAVTQQQLSAATPSPGLRASKMPDWKDTTAQILRATDQVEQVLGGENIFKDHQPDANQPIYNEALNLHEVTRGWSSRDNEIVAVAKRMAVLMAKLSAYMNSNKQHEVLTTSKAIVAESHEVSRLAKKLAYECSDHRIKTNLLQLCEKIPTISGQLKMLTTVKASSLGHQGTREDQEAMDMLVSNAQSLMISTRDVVNAANSASVKIMSQRGPKIKWVRKAYY